MSDWYTTDKLSVNTDKFEDMTFGSGKSEEIEILAKFVSRKKYCKCLGVNLDGSLKVNYQIDYMVIKLNKFYGLVYRNRQLFDKKCLMMFYNSFAKSVICYGLLIYGTGANSNLKKIEMAQRRTLRAVFFKKKYDSLENILVQNKPFSVFELFLVELKEISDNFNPIL